MNYSRAFLKEIYNESQGSSQLQSSLIEIDRMQEDKTYAFKTLQKQYDLKDEPNSGAEFFQDELLLAVVLASSVYTQGKKAIKAFNNYIKDDVRSVSVHYNQAIKEVENIMDDTFTETTQNRVSTILNTTIAKGALAGVGISTILQNNYLKDLVVKGMIKSAKFYTDNYFSRIVMPKLTKEVSNILGSAFTGPSKEVTLLHDILKSNLDQTPYWNLVANASASRAYNYGVVKSGLMSNFKEYEFVAVIDNVTTEICRSNNKKRFKIYDATKHYESMASMSHEEMIKRFPFFDGTENIDNNDLGGIKGEEPIYPPLHFNCRSCLKLV